MFIDPPAMTAERMPGKDRTGIDRSDPMFGYQLESVEIGMTDKNPVDTVPNVSLSATQTHMLLWLGDKALGMCACATGYDMRRELRGLPLMRLCWSFQNWDGSYACMHA